MNETGSEMSGDVRTLMPPDWAFSRGTGGAYMVCYRIVVLDQTEIPHLLTVDLLGCRMLLLWGSLPYVRTVAHAIKKWRYDKVDMTVEFEQTTTEPGAHLLCVAPCESEAEQASARARTSEAVGLGMALLGENFAHSLVFENYMHGDGRPVAILARFRLPIMFPPTGLPASAQWLKRTGERIAASAPDAQRRIAHAVTWLSEGMAKDGADGILAMWIGLEILTMRQGTDIRPINERLATLYGLDYRAACTRFCVGRLFGLRAEIVHGGSRATVTSNIAFYLRCVFVDCLAQELGVPSNATETALSDPALARALSALGKA